MNRTLAKKIKRYRGTSLVYRIYNSIWSFFNNIKRVMEWLPIIYKDRDFDHQCILQLLDYKLLRMNKYFIKEDILEKQDIQQMSRYMQLVRKLIRISSDDYYWNKYVKPVDAKYGGRQHSFEPTKDGKYVRLIQSWGLVMSPEEKEKADSEYLDASRRSYEQQHKAYKLIFKILEKKMNMWWS